MLKKLAPKVIDFAITENQYDATETIEKELLLSSFLLNFNPAKDMRSNFILDYIKEIENTFMSYNSTEDIINYFEGSLCGVCFTTRDNQTAKDSLHEYIISRLVLYKKLLQNYTAETIIALIVFTMLYIIGHLAYSDIQRMKILTS